MFLADPAELAQHVENFDEDCTAEVWYSQSGSGPESLNLNAPNAIVRGGQSPW